MLKEPEQLMVFHGHFYGPEALSCHCYHTFLLHYRIGAYLLFSISFAIGNEQLKKK